MGDCFPKTARLLNAGDYTAVLRRPDVNLSQGPLRIRAKVNKMQRPRLGLVVTKKGTPKATRRNRVKRIVRERFRRQATVLPAADFVVQVFGHIDDGEIAPMVDKALGRAAKRLAEPPEA